MESSIILWLQKTLASDAGRMFVGFCARWVIYLFIPLGIYTARLSKFMRHAVSEAAWSAALAFTLSSGIAMLIGRMRPYLAVKGIEAIVPPNLQSGSFPSSHTAVATAVAVALAFHDPRLGIIAIVMALLVAFGRVAAGMHFPSDILGGILVGALAFVIVRYGHNALAHLK